jgi:hypothetical protein
VTRTLQYYHHSGATNNKATIIYWLTDSQNLITFLTKGSGKNQIKKEVFQVMVLCKKLDLRIIPIHLLRENPCIKLADNGSKTAIIGPIQRREQQSAIWRSPNIDIVRKYADKYNQQNLFAFLTKYVSTSFSITSRKENGNYHAVLTLYGEERPFHLVHRLQADAKHFILLQYINKLCVNGFMLWSFPPGPNFLEFRRMIST